MPFSFSFSFFFFFCLYYIWDYYIITALIPSISSCKPSHILLLASLKFKASFFINYCFMLICIYIKILKYILLICICFQVFDIEQPMSVVFPGQDNFSCSQCSIIAYSSSCRIEALWFFFLDPLWHVFLCLYWPISSLNI